MSNAHVFISHTTHDRRDLHLAQRLAEGLKARGASVWIAPESIPASSLWREKIEAGIKKCTHFLVILSPASVIAPAVLDEIKLANERYETDHSFHILALVVGHIGTFSGSDFINSFQHLAYRDDPITQVDEVAQAIGLEPYPVSQFEMLIADKTDGFVGRDFVFEKVNDFVRKPNGYLVIEGEPGAGKTAILAKYTRMTGSPTHFNVAAEGITTTTQFLNTLSQQLNAKFGVAARLPENPASFGDHLRQMLENASDRLRKGEELTICVDALDEADSIGIPSTTNTLWLPAYLPNGIHFVVTKRVDVPHVRLLVQAPVEVINLGDYPEQMRKDIETYIEQAASRPSIRHWVDVQQISVADFVKILASKSANNFMYAHYVITDIEKGRYAKISIESLPVGLQRYYEYHWIRMGMTAQPLPRERLDVIYVLSEVRLPVSRKFLMYVTERDAVTVQSLLDQWAQFMHKHLINGQLRYTLYHNSFREFLHDKKIVEAAGVDLRTVKARITEKLWTAFDEQ